MPIPTTPPKKKKVTHAPNTVAAQVEARNKKYGLLNPRTQEEASQYKAQEGIPNPKEALYKGKAVPGWRVETPEIAAKEKLVEEQGTPEEQAARLAAENQARAALDAIISGKPSTAVPGQTMPGQTTPGTNIKFPQAKEMSQLELQQQLDVQRREYVEADTQKFNKGYEGYLRTAKFMPLPSALKEAYAAGLANVDVKAGRYISNILEIVISKSKIRTLFNQQNTPQALDNVRKMFSGADATITDQLTDLRVGIGDPADIADNIATMEEAIYNLERYNKEMGFLDLNEFIADEGTMASYVEQLKTRVNTRRIDLMQAQLAWQELKQKEAYASYGL